VTTTTLNPRCACAGIATGNLARNRQALAPLDLPHVQDLEWLLGRDGSLTARDADQRWLAGTSLPARVAESMLKKLELTGTVACFLAPPHAAFVRAALTKLRPQQAVIAVVADPMTLAQILHCDDFSSDIAAHRLWFVSGRHWAQELADLLNREPGLPTPSQFIRLPMGDGAEIDQMIHAAQWVFGDVSTRRGGALRNIVQLSQQRQSGRICVVAGSQFRLWDDGAGVLLELVNSGGDMIEHLDPDDPASASPMALAHAAARCEAIITAGIGRSDCPSLVSPACPWITFVGGQHVPAPVASTPDHLLVPTRACLEAAMAAGWGADRVHLVAAPFAHESETDCEQRSGLALIADMPSLAMPEALREFSSHRLLWDTVAAHLLGEPLALANDPVQYLKGQMRRLDIAADGFPWQAFIERLIVPAFQQGLAKLLIDTKLPIELFGQGWDSLPAFAAHCGGAVDSRQQLQLILRRACGVIHAWPHVSRHPLDHHTNRLLRPHGKSPAAVLQETRRLISAPVTPEQPPAPRLDMPLLQRILGWQ
jgi:hypothetical protein